MPARACSRSPRAAGSRSRRAAGWASAAPTRWRSSSGAEHLSSPRTRSASTLRRLGLARTPGWPAARGSRRRGHGQPHPGARRAAGDGAARRLRPLDHQCGHLGTGIAGVTTADFVRRGHPDCEIHLVGAEPHLLYNRMGISRIVYGRSAMSGPLPPRRAVVRRQPDHHLAEHPRHRDRPGGAAVCCSAPGSGSSSTGWSSPPAPGDDPDRSRASGCRAPSCSAGRGRDADPRLRPAARRAGGRRRRRGPARAGGRARTAPARAQGDRSRARRPAARAQHRRARQRARAPALRPGSGSRCAIRWRAEALEGSGRLERVRLDDGSRDPRRAVPGLHRHHARHRAGRSAPASPSSAASWSTT